MVAACAPRSTLPSSLSDQEFWRLVETLSEEGRNVGLSDNFVSNEPRVAENARWLQPAGWLRSSGGVYIGVGPEQNFTYIARLRPRLAFVVDIRRQNADLHLLYKALFEMSANRVEFVSRVFSRPAPPDLGRRASIDEIFDRIERTPASADMLAATVRSVRESLVTTHRFPLRADDLDGISRTLAAFYESGPAIHYWGSQAIERNTVRPSYRRLMTMPDMTGQQRSYLADEDGFQLLKEMQRRNQIVPVVGDFGGAGALRRIADYVRAHDDNVRAFYGSNVAVYLTNQQVRAYCGNLAALPAARGASFIESDSVISLAAKLQACGGGRSAGR
jgi:hypothetical protein